MSKFHGSTVEQLESKRAYYVSAIKEMTRLRNAKIVSSNSWVNWNDSIIEFQTYLSEIENLLRPKIDYEDGSWV